MSERKVNEVPIKGRVTDVSFIKKGQKQDGSEWQLHGVELDGVDGAGKGRKDAGEVSFTTFEGAQFRVGQLVGQLCRVVGKRKEYNKEGSPSDFVAVSLTAIGKPKVIEDAPDAAGKPVAEETEVPW